MSDNKEEKLSRTKMEEQLKEVRNVKEVFETLHTELSSLLYARYESLQKAGFAQAEAFSIILHSGLG